MLELRRLEVRAGGRSLLTSFSWSSAGGRRILLQGPSGCGKTTLLYLIAGLAQPATGSIHVLGHELTRMDRGERDRFRARWLGMIFQDFHLLRAINVLDNLRLASRFAGLKVPRKAALRTLESLEVAHLARRDPRVLSQGEKQRVAIARALVHEPALIVADEPTSSLDDANCERVLGLLEEHAGRLGAALLVASHDARIRSAFDTRLELEPVAEEQA